MKFWTKDLLNVPSTIVSGYTGVTCIQLLKMQGELSKGTVVWLVLCILLAGIAVLCNVVLAYKLIKEQSMRKDWP